MYGLKVYDSGSKPVKILINIICFLNKIIRAVVNAVFKEFWPSHTSENANSLRRENKDRKKMKCMITPLIKF